MIIQLYIQGQRIELFEDESVTITDSIQNVKDIDKVFTSFTQSFSIPASKVNNKIFKHYYNYDIVGGFDARKKVVSTIELNNLPFRTGKVKLEGVDLKNNKPHTYRITFFGDIVDLKDKLGEKKLSDLNDLSVYDLDYDVTNIETKLTSSITSSTHIIAPLITHTQRLFFDSTPGHAHDDQYSGNLYYQAAAGHIHGVKWNQLKYAIRVNKVIEAIESQFGLSFSDDFFKNTSKPEFNNLFLWLHRKSGFVENLSGSESTIETQVNGWTPSSDQAFEITSTTFTIGGEAVYYLDRLQLELYTTSTTPYTIEILRDGTSVYFQTGIVGNKIIDGYAGDFDVQAGDYTVYITAAGSITFTDIIWDGEYITPEDTVDVYYQTGTFITASSFRFNVNKQMPEIKILDFLTGLFKVFNLTAYVSNGVIIVKPLDDFYSSYSSYDITEFIDVDSSKVDVALPYKEIIFKFKDTATFLAQKFGEINNRTWGEISYNASETDLAGSLYKVEAPFGHMLFERLTPLTSAYSVQYGWNVDKSQNAYLGSPLLFYPINVYTNGISFVDDVDINDVPTSHKEIFNVNLPFNHPDINPANNPKQLNFNREFSEWTLNTNYSESLFNEYYSNYIVDVFNPKARLTKVKAYLPMRILLNYNLSDTFIIAGNEYKINSISTNLLTGESNLELLNIV